MFAFLVLALAFCFSVLLPLAILSLRSTVRLQRQSVILDLQQMFAMKETGEQRGAKPVPSFEFVKHKYFPQMVEFDAVKSRLFPAAQYPQHDLPSAKKLKYTSNLTLIICSLPLVLLTFILSVFSFSVIFRTVLPIDVPHILPPFLHFKEPSTSKEQQAVLWVLVVAFLGGYLFVVRALLRAVNNFDLSPGSFLSAALHLLLGVITAAVIVLGVVDPAVTGLSNAGIVLPASIAAAFLIGFVPELGLRTLYRASRLRTFKREDHDLYESFQATPVEVVDGIDTEIRGRLAEFNILSVQNLATANPIMLFVETPYGIYQSVDWVAQAQLFAAVGPKTVLKLWKLGIRTIFDLEKAVLAPGYTTKQVRQAVGLALLAGADDATRQRIGPVEGPLDDDSIKALVQNKVDDLHVHRLRQIVTRIEAHLGPENKRYAAPDPASRPAGPANDESDAASPPATDYAPRRATGTANGDARSPE